VLKEVVNFIKIEDMEYKKANKWTNRPTLLAFFTFYAISFYTNLT